MAEITLAGGLVIDVASGKELDDHADKLLEGIRGSGASKPLYQTRFAAAVTPAAGSSTQLLKFGRPSTGKLWNLVYLTLFGVDDRTVLAGAVAASYVGNPDAPTLHGLIDPGKAIPSASNYGPEEIWVHDSEELFVIVYGAANGVSMGGVARVLEHDAEAREGRR